MRSAVYLRISQDRMGLELGVERQREDCLALAARRGWSDPEVFVDNDLSATKGGRRPDYDRLMAAVVAGEIDRIICWHTSRLWRNRTERAQGIEKLRTARVSIVGVKGPELDMSTAAGRAIAGVLGEFDTWEVEVKSERVARETIQYAERGLPPGGPRARGYTKDGTALVPDEAEQVKAWYEGLLAGRSITKMSTEAGLHHSSLVTILRNPRNCALRVLDGVEYPGNWPAIVPVEVWRAAVALLDDPGRRTNGNQTARRWLLSGAAGCQRCDGLPVAITYNGGGNSPLWPIYKCKARRGGCNRSWAASRLDEWIADLVAARLGRPDVADLLPKDRPDLDAARLEVKAIRKRLGQVAADFVTLGMDEEQVRTATAAGKARLAELETLLGDARRHGPLAPLLTVEDPVAAWRAIPVEQVDRRQAVVRSLMTITLGAAPRGRGFDPERFVFIDWRGQA